MKIKTELLKEMLSKSIQGAGCNKMLPITSLLGIEFKENELTLMTTDGSNQLRVKQVIDDSELTGMPKEFYTIVDAETFSKLIGKTTKEVVELNNQENCLLIEGNGTYKLDIPINEDGEIIKFPNIPEINSSEVEQISIENLKNTLTSAKASVAKTLDVPCLTGYYIGTKSITTDRQMVFDTDLQLLKNNAILISSEMAELIHLLNGETVDLRKDENKLLLETANVIIYGKELEGKDIYPVAAIENLLNLEYANNMKVKKQDLLDVLDRMSLFVTDYDKNSVKLSFTKEALSVKSMKSNAQELIDGECSSEIEFDCCVDIEQLKSQIQTLSADVVTIYYGQEKSIKIVEGNCTMIISLVDVSK